MNVYEIYKTTRFQSYGRCFGRGCQGAMYQPDVIQPVGCRNVAQVNCRGRGILRKASRGLASECICDRPKTGIVCKMCCYILPNARLFINCKFHPSVLYLMDVKQCPCCGTTCNNMIELPEDMDRKKRLPTGVRSVTGARRQF